MLNYLKASSAFLLWALVALTSHFYISNKHFNNCNLENNYSEEESIKKKKFLITDTSNTIIYKFDEGFTINKHNANVSSIKRIPNFIDSLQHILHNDYTVELLIIGNYLQNEASSNFTQNLGLQRAEFLKKELIREGIDASKIKALGKILNFSFNNEGTYSNGIEIKFNSLQQNSIDSIENEIKNKTLYIEFKNDSLISTKKLTNYTLILKQYLKKYPDKKVVITGHTDNLGYYENNLIIGLNRANKVKEYFVKNNIESNKITSLSKGESEPIAEKLTEKGRAKNRRIEIIIK